MCSSNPLTVDDRAFAVTNDPVGPLTICHGAAWAATSVSGEPSIGTAVFWSSV